MLFSISSKYTETEIMVGILKCLRTTDFIRKYYCRTFRRGCYIIMAGFMDKTLPRNVVAVSKATRVRDIKDPE